jgi:hypothetical protein
LLRESSQLGSQFAFFLTYFSAKRAADLLGASALSVINRLPARLVMSLTYLSAVPGTGDGLLYKLMNAFGTGGPRGKPTNFSAVPNGTTSFIAVLF